MTKTILIAHCQAAVRDRFTSAVADARHGFVAADSAEAALDAVRSTTVTISLALVDVGLAEDPIGFLRALRTDAATPLPIMVFSGSVRSAADVPALAALGASYINEYAATPQILPAIAPHLFPDNFNRRIHTRLSLGVPVTYRAGDTIAGAVTLDLGKGGLAIRTMNPLPKGTAIQVRFRLPGLPAEIEAATRVAWSDQKVGMGVEFETISPVNQRTIDQFVDASA